MTKQSDESTKNERPRQREFRPLHPFLLTAGQQHSLMIVWVSLIAVLATCYLTRRGVDLIDIDQAKSRQTDFAVEINSAPAEEFQCLPGIGKKTAKAIVRYRELHGPFESVDSMSNVSGVSTRMLKSLETFLYKASPKEPKNENPN